MIGKPLISDSETLPFFMQKWLSFASKLYHLYFVIKRVAVLIK